MRLRLAAIVAAAAASLLLPTAPQAALPLPRTQFEAHDHATPGDGYHLQLRVGQQRRRVDFLFVYAQKCDATPYVSNVPISESGRLSVTRTFTTTEGGVERTGTVEIQAGFVSRRTLQGWWRISIGGCDTRARSFSAVTGEEDDHLGHLGGPAPVDVATPAERAQARRLWLTSRRLAARRFPTYTVARRMGYVPHPDQSKHGLFFHLENRQYRADRHVLDPRFAESLVYWRVPRHAPVLVGFMFRVRRGHEPDFAGPIGNWHTHGRGRMSMMHVWFTHELETAFWRGHSAPATAIERELIAPSVKASHRGA